VKVSSTKLSGVFVVEPRVHQDGRGVFFESYQEDRYREAGMTARFVQDNVSRSVGGTLRGLHLQYPDDQTKLVYVLHGEVFDVAVDVRPNSPTFRGWHGELLTGENARQLYIPAGFAHGFCVLSESALFAYKVSALYSPESEITIAWNDPEIGIEWPIDSPTLSARDQQAKGLADQARLPTL